MTVIFVSFARLRAAATYGALRALTVKHGLGFHDYNVTDAEAWFSPPSLHRVPGLTLTLERVQPCVAPHAALIDTAVDWLNPAAGTRCLILEHRTKITEQTTGE